MKGVAMLGLFAVILACATAYSTYKSALAETTTVQPQTPECLVYFDPEKTDVSIGETFTVTVMVDDVKKLWGYEIGLKFDRSVVEYVGSKHPHWRFISGQIEHLFWVAGTTPQNGQVKLMEFTFEGIAEGNSELSLYVHKLATYKYWEVPKDYLGWPIAHSVSEGTVTVW